MNFSTALDALKQGAKVQRQNWNGKGMWLTIIQKGNAGYALIDNQEWVVESYIAMKTADDKLVPWLASQTDILAEDWQVSFTEDELSTEQTAKLLEDELNAILSKAFGGAITAQVLIQE